MDERRTSAMPGSPRHRAIGVGVSGWLRLRSETFVGEWPVGVHWRPGEVRVIPPDYPRDGEPPPGLVKEPQEGAAGEG
jgi:hypothetical protein